MRKVRSGTLLACGTSLRRLAPKGRILKANLKSMALFILGTIVGILATWNQPWTMVRLAGLCLLVPAGILLVVARLQLGSSFSVRPEARTLVTNGLYSRIRNPIYLFGGLTLAGFILLLNKPWYLLAFLVVVPVQIQRTRREEDVLTVAFGKTYLEYKDRTWF